MPHGDRVSRHHHPAVLKINGQLVALSEKRATLRRTPWYSWVGAPSWTGRNSFSQRVALLQRSRSFQARYAFQLSIHFPLDIANSIDLNVVSPAKIQPIRFFMEETGGHRNYCFEESAASIGSNLPLSRNRHRPPRSTRSNCLCISHYLSARPHSKYPTGPKDRTRTS
jgi:hypothetical protein